MTDNPFNDEDYDRFSFHPGDLTPVTDPEELAVLYRKTGIRPYPEEKQVWISREGKARYRQGLSVSTFDLSDEYDRRKALGQL